MRKSSTIASNFTRFTCDPCILFPKKTKKLYFYPKMENGASDTYQTLFIQLLYLRKGYLTLNLLDDLHLRVAEVVTVPQENLGQPDLVHLCKHGHLLRAEILSGRVQCLVYVGRGVHIDGRAGLKGEGNIR